MSGAGPTQAAGGVIRFEDVSKFYGEVLGINRVNLTIPPGLTSLVGPNGSGKTTLMNLMTGLIRPSRGWVSVVGVTPASPEDLFRLVGYCTQFDAFPRGVTGLQFVRSFLMVGGYARADADALARRAIERVGMTAAAQRRVAAYSKGMRQRIKLAQSIAHQPTVLVLDEPLNGLDPMARSEMIALFKDLAAEGLHVIVSSHILHEVDLISDRVVILKGGYVIAEGSIRSVRSEIEMRPMQVLIRCSEPARLAARVLEQDHVVEVKMHHDRLGLLVSTRDADSFYLLMNRIVTENGIGIESIVPADEDVHAVYEYLIGSEGEGF